MWMLAFVDHNNSKKVILIMRLFALLLLCTSPLLSHASPSHQSEGYATSSWATLHGDGRNSSHVPLLVTTQLQPQWLALKGASSWSAPVIAEDGTLYVTTGRGKGFAHLHAISRTGRVLWESPVAQSQDDLDAEAVFSAPLLDRDGHVYVGDSNQFWSFTVDGKVRWVANLRDLGIRQPLMGSVIVGSHVGGVSADGVVVLFDRNTGRPAVPPLRLPVPAGEPGRILPEGLWAKGLLDDKVRQKGWDLLTGQGYAVSHVPAVHPHQPRLFVTAGGGDGDVGQLFAIDVGADGLSIRYASEVPARTSSSPVLSADASRIYAVGHGGTLYALDSETGKLLWQRATEGENASPSVGPGDMVYVLGGDRLIAVEGETGQVLWRNNYREWARDRHPQLWSRFGLIGSRGKPDAYIDSVVTISNGLLWATLLVGYDVNFLVRDFVHPVQAYLVALDPSDGTVLEEWRVPDSSEGVISISPTGDVYLNLMSMQASLAHHGGYQWLLPKSIRRPKPRGGIYALAPVSLAEQLTASIQWLDTLASNRNPLFLEGIDSQLWSSRKVLALAVKRGELEAGLGRHVESLLQQSEAALSRCKTNTDDCEALFDALESMAKALL
ncbi:outer membrane protein assembly factor BamB [Litorivivens lipolytica]|uniref:Outer membrane protein assembly factor BamB n=1 Tax=Litorivivens lipolytica TaxID=1524264 RepID=A0A7W4Z5P9_9GAMM|nr:PQQ-binding-like beta-propeller repeat protein [Litorivivens lipolytica]MBB3047403.1 outer membrane protein assembly factor BamB [Litorivivens lipolytica]